MPVVINGSNTPTAGGVAIGNGSELQFTPAGTSGQVLVSNGSGAPTWQTGGGTLPSQTGQGGNFLTTDGSTASWAAIPTPPSGSSFTATASGNINSGNVVVVNDDGTVSAAYPGASFSLGSAVSYTPFGTDTPFSEQIALDSANDAAYFYFSYYNGSTNDYYIGKQSSTGLVTSFPGSPFPVMITPPVGSLYANPNGILVVGSNLYVLWAWLPSGGVATNAIQKYSISPSGITFVSEITIVATSTNYPNRSRFAYDEFNNQLVGSFNITNAPFEHVVYTVNLSTFTASTPVDIQSTITSSGIDRYLDFNIAVNPNNGYFVISGLAFSPTYNQIPYGIVIGNSAGLSGSTTITASLDSTYLQPYTKALPMQFVSTNQMVYMSVVDNSATGNPYFPDQPNFVRAISVTDWATSPSVTWGTATRTQFVGESGNTFSYTLTATPTRKPYGIMVNTTTSLTEYFDVLLDTASPANLTIGYTATVYPGALNTLSNVPYNPVSKTATFYYIASTPTGSVAYGVAFDTTEATNISLASVVGISDSSFLSGATATVKTLGAVSTSQTGLSVPSVYYLNSLTGGITTSPTGIQIGKSLSTTNLLITL